MFSLTFRDYVPTKMTAEREYFAQRVIGCYRREHAACSDDDAPF